MNTILQKLKYYFIIKDMQEIKKCMLEMLKVQKEKISSSEVFIIFIFPREIKLQKINFMKPLISFYGQGKFFWQASQCLTLKKDFLTHRWFFL